MIFILSYSEQLKTIQTRANILANSLQLSDLPVPAGPMAEAPIFIFRALITVVQQRSVKGVITNLPPAPTNS